MRLTSDAPGCLFLVVALAYSLLAVPTGILAETLSGRVVGVGSGDTVTVLATSKQQLEVRLAGIDAPDRKQPYWRQSKEALANLVLDRQVTVAVLKIDQYDRAVGHVSVDGERIGPALIAGGSAWVYRRFNDDPELLALEQQAEEQRLGLWALPESQRIPPWIWRRQSRSPYYPGSWSGKVVGVYDGDTLTVMHAGKTQIKIRFAGIDAPERAAPWGKRAKHALSALVFGREIMVTALKQDKYGRTVANVTADGVNVGRELIRKGNAWVYRKYSDDPALLALEQQAREQRFGLWALPPAQRIPPWEWRRLKKERAHQARTAASNAVADTTCGTKRYCSEMVNCAEARFYLSQCGVSSLDGDRDGRPCSKLCRR